MFVFGKCCSNVVTADFTIMPIALLLYDSIGFVFRYHYILSIKVNYSPCLVFLHQIMDKLFSPLPFKAYLCLP